MDGTVIGIKPHPKNEAWRVVTVDGKDFIVFSGKAADALVIGASLPEGTSQDPPKFEGALPSLKLPYKPGGGAPAAFRNTKEGFALEQDSIHRSVALKLAMKQYDGVWSNTQNLANKMYEWLANRGEGQQDAEVRASGDEAAKPITERTTDPIPEPTSEGSRSSGTGAAGSPARNRASEETSDHDGEGVADESKGERVPSGGPSRALSPEDNPWEGMDV